MNRLADYGVASSFAVGGLTDSKIRDMGFDPIEISVPPLDTPVDRTSDGWSPYHFLALRTVKTLLDHVEAYRKAISDGNPALVVTDINPVAALAAKSLRVPHATISQSLFLPFRKINSTRWAMPPALTAINAVLNHYGVEPVASAEYLDMGEITFLPSIPEFDPLEDAPASIHYLGPVLGNQHVPLPQTDRPPSANPIPEVFFYPGRPHDAAGASGQALLNLGLDALSALDVTVTLATGGYDFIVPDYSGRRLEVVPWRVISADYKPDLILHHGGHGTCLTAISVGIPSAIVPTHAEREYNARNLAALGCGEFVAVDQADVRHIRLTIEGALANPAYARRCARWSQAIAARKYEGADLAARIIARTVGASP